jgi:hypothetical protein
MIYDVGHIQVKFQLGLGPSKFSMYFVVENLIKFVANLWFMVLQCHGSMPYDV